MTQHKLQLRRKTSMLAKMRAALTDGSSENMVAIGDPDQRLSQKKGRTPHYLKQCLWRLPKRFRQCRLNRFALMFRPWQRPASSILQCSAGPSGILFSWAASRGPPKAQEEPESCVVRPEATFLATASQERLQVMFHKTELREDERKTK